MQHAEGKIRNVRKTEEKKMPSKTHAYMDTSSSTMLRKSV